MGATTSSNLLTVTNGLYVYIYVEEIHSSDKLNPVITGFSQVERARGEP